MSKSINTKEYTYDLPEDRIALHPLAERDQSKLLIYKEGKISHDLFSRLPEYLPQNACLYFNDTKVIPARLLFQKPTGATIEVFLLQPVNANQPVQLSMETKGTTRWLCTIGNLKRWKEEVVLESNHNGITLQASHDKGEVVTFKWEPPELSFGEIVDIFGETPLPPYLNRKPVTEDRVRYQTVYSHYEGAVAAPTAGLHFTEKVLADLKQHNISREFLTLHVSAGTFQPIKTENALEHTMHSEQMVVSRSTIEKLRDSKEKIIAVGTTSMRTLESLYWYGVKLKSGGSDEFSIDQSYPYDHDQTKLPGRSEAMQAIIDHMKDSQMLIGTTSIYIVPGYQFKVCDGLITNFHQPGSTLMLLVAAFVGSEWKPMYEYALQNDFRFLSYGDSSLLLPAQNSAI